MSKGTTMGDGSNTFDSRSSSSVTGNAISQGAANGNNGLSWPSILTPRRRRRSYQYSVDRLRVVYTDLLQHIDYESTVSRPTPTSNRYVASSSSVGNNEEKKEADDGDHHRIVNTDSKVDFERSHQHRSRQGVSAEDLDHLKRSLRFSFRRSLIPTPTTPTRTSKSKRQADTVHAAAVAAADAVEAASEAADPKTDKELNVDTTFDPVSDAVPRPKLPSPETESRDEGNPTDNIVVNNNLADSLDKKSSISSKLDLDAAFCLLAATRSPSSQPYGLGNGGGGSGRGTAGFSQQPTSVAGSIPSGNGIPQTTSTTVTTTISGRRVDHYDGDQIYRNSMQRAEAIEKRVVDLIETLGIIVVNGETSYMNSDSGRFDNGDQGGHGGGVFTIGKRSSLRGGRTDPVFEYFTEKCILSLLVDIAKEARYPEADGDGLGQPGNNSLQPSSSRSASRLSVRGVVWSGAVKAQVYRTVSMLIADVRNQSVLYFFLSNNFVNELIQCMLPIQQWTDPALALMLPAYVDLLKTLTLQLTDDPQLFPFLTTVQEGEDGSQYVSFPLFSAALEVATSYHGQSDSQVYATMLAVVVSIMQIPYSPIQTWLSDSAESQRKLSFHLCQRLVELYQRITNTTTGPVVDGTRHDVIAHQLVSLKDHLRLIHEVFWSGVRGLDVRLCEALLRGAVAPILTSIPPRLKSSARQRQFLIVGLIDADIIPGSEAMAQASVVVLCLMFSTLSYTPFQRMLAVALLHPESSAEIWSSSTSMDGDKSPDDYIFMPLLSDIVNKETSRQTCPNIFREEICTSLRGDRGEWRTTTTACLLQTVLNVATSESEIINALEIISGSGEHHSDIEEAVSSFLTKEHAPSAISAQAIVCVGYLSLQLLKEDLIRSVQDTNDVKRTMESCLAASPIWNGMLDAYKYFCSNALKAGQVVGVADIFLELIEGAIRARYTPRYNEKGQPTYTCLLSRIGSAEHTLDAEVLVRQLRGVSPSDVEDARFYISLSLHFRSLCKVIERLCFSIEEKNRSTSPKRASPSKKSGNTSKHVTLDLVEKVDDLCRSLGGFDTDTVEPGSDMNLSGRMAFRFKSNLKKLSKSMMKGLHKADAGIKSSSSSSSASAKKTSGEENIAVLRPTSHLMLVLDQNAILVVKPTESKAVDNRGVVLCSISLRSIIAAADDGSWLHVATKHDDIAGLIKNGNMALDFDSPSTCLIVKQYLDRSREVLKQDMMEKARSLLRPHTGK